MKSPWYPFSFRLLPESVKTVHSSHNRGANTESVSVFSLVPSGAVVCGWSSMGENDDSDGEIGLLILLTRLCTAFFKGLGRLFQLAVTGEAAVVAVAVTVETCRDHFCNNLSVFALLLISRLKDCLPSASSSSSSLSGTPSVVSSLTG